MTTAIKSIEIQKITHPAVLELVVGSKHNVESYEILGWTSMPRSYIFHLRTSSGASELMF